MDCGRMWGNGSQEYGGDAAGAARAGHTLRLCDRPLAVAIVAGLLLTSAGAGADTFYRGHQRGERPIVSGAAKGNYNPPNFSHQPWRSVDALVDEFLQHNPSTNPNRHLYYELQMAFELHAGTYRASARSPFVSVTTNETGARGSAEQKGEGEVLHIEVGSSVTCTVRQWRELVVASGTRVTDENHPVFRQCWAFQTLNYEESEWVFLHHIPNSLVRGTYPWPEPPDDDDGSETGGGDEGGTGTPPGTRGGEGGGRTRMRGRPASSRGTGTRGPTRPAGAAGTTGGATAPRTMNLGGAQINLDTLYSTATAYLKKQFQAALQAKQEEAIGLFQAESEGYVQEIYQDFLYWLNAEIQAEFASRGMVYNVESAEFEREFMAWLDSPGDQLRAYIERYVREQSATIAWLLDAYHEQESREIVSGLQAIWEDAKKKYDRFTDAADEAVADPDTPYAETLEKYGFSGSWIDRFKSYEGQFNTFDDNYKAVEASKIVVGAFQSDVPRDKIAALFQLLEHFGGVAEESKIPIVSFFGQIVRTYGEVATQMLGQIDQLAERLRQRQGYCLGEGTTADKRNELFVATFGDGLLICPTLVSPDIYESWIPNNGPLYFFVEEKFIVGQENGGGMGGVHLAIDLITRAGVVGKGNLVKYAGKEGDVKTIAQFYNVTYEHEEHGRALAGLLTEADTTVDGIGERLTDLERGLDSVGEECKKADLYREIRSRTGYRRLTSGDGDELEEYRRREEELKVLFAVAFIEGRSGGAYKTYSEIWNKLEPLSLLRIYGTVRDARLPVGSPCDRCAGADVSISPQRAAEIGGCEVDTADEHGRFLAQLLTDSADLRITLQATADGATSERIEIDRRALDIEQVPFDSRSFSISLPIEFENEEEDEDEEEGDGVDPEGEGESTVDPAVLLERMQGAAAATRSAIESARAACAAAEAAAQRATEAATTAESELARLNGETDALAGEVAGLGGLLARAQGAANEAYQSAEQLATLRDQAGALRDAACGAADAVAKAPTHEERNRLLGEVGTAVDGLRALRPKGATLTETMRGAVEEARGAEREAQALLPRIEEIASGVEGTRRAVDEAGAELETAREQVAAAEEAIAEVEQGRNNVRAAFTDALGSVGGPDEDGTAGANLAAMEALAVAIDAEADAIADCPEAAASLIEGAAEALSAAASTAAELGARVGELRTTVEDGGLLAEISAAVAEADATVAVAEMFDESLQARLDDAALCQEIGEGNALAPLPAPDTEDGGDSGDGTADGGDTGGEWTSSGGVETVGGSGGETDESGSTPPAPVADPVIDGLIAEAGAAFNRCAGAGRGGVDRRLRHGLLIAEPPQALSDRHAQDRPCVRAGPRQL